MTTLIVAGLAVLLLLGTCAVGTVVLYKEDALAADWRWQREGLPIILTRRRVMALTIVGVIAGLMVALATLWSVVAPSS